MSARTAATSLKKLRSTAAVNTTCPLQTTKTTSLHHRFSSSSEEEDNPKSLSSPPPPPPDASMLTDIKPATLPNTPRHHSPRQHVPVSMDRIRRDLGEFRIRSDAPPASPVSFQGLSAAKPEIVNTGCRNFRKNNEELYKRHMASKEANPSSETNKDFTHSFSAIRDSLRQFRGNTPKPKESALSLENLKNTFASRPDPKNPALAIGSPQKFPESVLSIKMTENEEGNTSPAMKTAFVKMYSYKELGEKLRKLRPEGKSGDGFSLEELNERLVKLREMEERETESKMGNEVFRDLRSSLVKLQISDNKKNMKQIDLLNKFGQTSTLMLDPPKQHLVEKYFHPDNMSSAEKLKIELQKVRDEFKMSESDCGSARVQVAQLTTKIKHLATALHPKDKHSRKGLLGMIQQRKKLLKYLRRTDWDSYTLVLSKLSLRDNPDYKN